MEPMQPGLARWPGLQRRLKQLSPKQASPTPSLRAARKRALELLCLFMQRPPWDQLPGCCFLRHEVVYGLWNVNVPGLLHSEAHN